MDANGIDPATTVPASQKLGKTEAARMAREASRVIVAKGKKVTEFKPGGKAAADVGDRTYKLGSSTTSESGRYVKYPGGAP